MEAIVRLGQYGASPVGDAAAVVKASAAGADERPRSSNVATPYS
jgi:hypothetical protein